MSLANLDIISIDIFLSFPDGFFGNQSLIWTTSSRSLYIYVSDINNDKLLYIVTANYDTHSIIALMGYGNGSFSTQATYSTGYDSSPLSVISGDFNKDNQLDLAIAHAGTDNVIVLFGNSNGSFTEPTTFSTGCGSHPHSVAVGHFNDDTLLDIAVANYGTNNVGILLGYGNGTFACQTTYSLGTASLHSIVIDDFNQDNRLGIIVTNNGTNNIGTLLGYGHGTFVSAKMYSTESSFTISVGVGDFNNDYRSDIIVVNNDIAGIDLLLGYDEGFANQTTYVTGLSPYSVAVVDFNNNSPLDIVVPSFDANNVGVLLGYGNGSFAH